MKIEETARRLSIERYSSHGQLPYDAHRDGIVIGIREGLRIALRIMESEPYLPELNPDTWRNEIHAIIDGKAEIPTEIPEEVRE